MIHKYTDIHPDAKIAENVRIDAFTTIDADVEIGEGSWIGPNVTIHDGARIGKNVRIYSGAVISAAPQDLKYKGERTFAIIGDNSIIREGVTFNRGTTASGETRMGKDCLLMAYSHIAHDCVLGDHVIIANATLLAGHIFVDDWAILGGMCAIHQFVRIGKHVMLGGVSGVNKDIPPFSMSSRTPAYYFGLNIVGLRRRNYTSEQITVIKDMYEVLYSKSLSLSQATQEIASYFPPSSEKDELVKFLKGSEKGIIRPKAQADSEEEFLG